MIISNNSKLWSGLAQFCQQFHCVFDKLFRLFLARLRVLVIFVPSQTNSQFIKMGVESYVFAILERAVDIDIGPVLGLVHVHQLSFNHLDIVVFEQFFGPIR